MSVSKKFLPGMALSVFTALSTAIVPMTVLAPTALAQGQMTIGQVASAIANATSAAEINTAVANAQAAGFTSQQIASAFGAASAFSANPQLVQSSFASFVQSSGADSAALNAAYASARETSTRQVAGGASGPVVVGNQLGDLGGISSGGGGGGGASPNT